MFGYCGKKSKQLCETRAGSNGVSFISLLLVMGRKVVSNFSHPVEPNVTAGVPVGLSNVSICKCNKLEKTFAIKNLFHGAPAG